MTDDTRDIVERLEKRIERLADPNADANDLLVALGYDLREAINVIKFLRKAAGAMTDGPSFAEITKDMKHQPAEYELPRRADS